MRSIPVVGSRTPLWDRPGLAEEVEAGRHWLPGTVFGGRESLATSPVHAQVRHLLRLPGDGWSPFVAAAGTAGFFLLLTVAWLVPAFAAGAVAVGALVVWLWGSDRPPPAPTAPIGDGVSVPTTATGRASPSWWAVLILVAVDSTVFASLAFAHLHVAMALDVCPPPGSRLPGVGLAAAALLGAGGTLVLAATRCPLAGRQHLLRAAAAAGCACVAGAFAVDLLAHQAAGLAPRESAWAATVAALLAWQGLHAVLLGALALYLVARSFAGRLRPDARATLDNAAPLGLCAAAQGLAGLALVRLLPAWMAP